MIKKKGAFGVVFQDVTRLNTIPPAAKGLYAYLAALSGDKDECYPSVELIRHEMGMSKDSFYKHMGILIAAGVVEKVQIKTESCRFGKNVYKLTHEVYFSEKPYTKKSDTESPTTESKYTKNNSIKNNNLNNNNNNLCASDNAPKVSKAAINEFFESIWKLYPSKKGKGQISDSKKKVLYNIGYDELSRAIERYKSGLAKDEWRKPQNGSTFFNSGYIDYLDANYSEPEQITDPEEGDRSIYQDEEDYRRLREELG